MNLSVAVLKNIFSEHFLQILIRTSVAEFIFDKTLCLQHICLEMFRGMSLKFENYSLRGILF